MLFSNLVTFALTSITCGAYISGLGFLARQGLLEKNLSRKIMHIGEFRTRLDALDSVSSISC